MKAPTKSQSLALKMTSTFLATALLVFGFQNCGAGFGGASSSSTNSASISSDIFRSATSRVEIPIYSEQLNNGFIRYSISIKIGNSGPIQALLDTGSAGLRVYANQLSDSDYADYGTPTQNVYGGTVQFSGTMVNGKLKIGGIKKPVDFALIQDLSCTAAAPNCAVSGKNLDTYAIGGDGTNGTGYQAIIGIGMRNVDTPNPLASMGINSWIVNLPQPGDDTPGTLVLNPSASEIAGYQMIQMDQSPSGIGWMDNRLQGCLLNENSGNDFCLNTLLDTGAFNIQIKSQNFGNARKIAAGQTMYFRINGAGDDAAAVEFNTGDYPGNSVSVVSSASELMNAGPYPFYNYSVYYSYSDGLIGFQGR